MLHDTYNMVRDFIFKDWITPIYIIIFFVVWTSNAYKLSNFDVMQLNTLYITVKAVYLTQHGVDSKYNSPLGTPPNTDDKK